MPVAEKLFTLEEFAKLPDDGQLRELVRGRIVAVNPPKPNHGYVCSNVAGVYRNHVKQQGLGRVLSNDSGVVTERDPDTLRGADVAFFSYTRLPRGPLPRTYPPVSPELVFEVLSDEDRWSKVLEKVAEYLNAGVLVVCVVDPEKEKVHVYRENEETQVVTADEELLIPEVFGDFRARVREFFE